MARNVTYGPRALYALIPRARWTDIDATKQMDTLAPMLAQRPVLEAAGVRFDRIANYEPLWTIGSL